MNQDMNQTHPTHQSRLKVYNLEEISSRLVENIEDLIAALGLDSNYYTTNRRLMMACPVHGGDNPEGFSIMLSGIGNWQCFTRQCHVDYGNVRGASIISLIQAIKKLEFFEAVDWAAKFLGDGEDLKENALNKQSHDFVKMCKVFDTTSDIIMDKPIPRSTVIRNVSIPANYFQNRGFSKEILSTYDIGVCENRSKPMYQRAVVPLYDETGKYMIGCTGRSIFERCETCKYYHSKTIHCPISNEDIIKSVKWRNTNFKAERYVYNLWRAKEHIKNSGTIILVEGPADIWKLEEAGIKNGLALLGTKFTDHQKQLIESLAATNLIIATDNDEAGLKSRKFIRSECSRLFNIYDVIPPDTSKDWGEMQTEMIQTIFNKTLERIT